MHRKDWALIAKIINIDRRKCRGKWDSLIRGVKNRIIKTIRIPRNVIVSNEVIINNISLEFKEPEYDGPLVFTMAKNELYVVVVM